MNRHADCCCSCLIASLVVGVHKGPQMKGYLQQNTDTTPLRISSLVLRIHFHLKGLKILKKPSRRDVAIIAIHVVAPRAIWCFARPHVFQKLCPNLGKPRPQVPAIWSFHPTAKPLWCHRPSCQNEASRPQPLTTTDVLSPGALSLFSLAFSLLCMCVLLSLEPRDSHRLALHNKNKGREGKT